MPNIKTWVKKNNIGIRSLKHYLVTIRKSSQEISKGIDITAIIDCCSKTLLLKECATGPAVLPLVYGKNMNYCSDREVHWIFRSINISISPALNSGAYALEVLKAHNAYLLLSVMTWKRAAIYCNIGERKESSRLFLRLPLCVNPWTTRLLHLSATKGTKELKKTCSSTSPTHSGRRAMCQVPLAKECQLAGARRRTFRAVPPVRWKIMN